MAMFSFFFENKKRATKLLVPCSSKIKNNVSCNYAVACFSVMVAAICKKKSKLIFVQSTLKHILVLLFYAKFSLSNDFFYFFSVSMALYNNFINGSAKVKKCFS